MLLRFPTFPAALPGAALLAVPEQPFHAAHVDYDFLIVMEDADGRPQGLEITGQFRAQAGLGRVDVMQVAQHADEASYSNGRARDAQRPGPCSPIEVPGAGTQPRAVAEARPPVIHLVKSQ